MAYTTQNFRTKSELKQALAERQKISVFNPGLGPDLSQFTGEVCVEGPHAPEPHRWYARVRVKDGQVITVS